MGMIKQKLLEKANYFVVGLFVLLSICFADTTYADDKQDIAELEAFYHLVFDQNPTTKIFAKSQPEKIQTTKKVPSAKQASPNAKKTVSFETNQNIDDKDPELVAFYEHVFGKKQIKIKQKVNNAKGMISKSKPHTITPLINSQILIEEKPVETEEQNIRDMPKKSISISQNIVPQKEESLSSDDTPNEQSSDLAALFAKAFGKKAIALPPKINVDLRINKEILGDVIIFSNKKRNKIDKVQTETLLILLEDILKEHVFKRTKDAISTSDKVTFLGLKKLGVVASYNPSELSLDLQIDSALRKPQILTFRKRSNGFTRDENKIEASETSAFVNMYSNIGLNSGTDPDLKLKLESSFNLRGTTLESDATYLNEKWSTGDKG